MCNGGSDAIIIGNRLHFIDGSFNAIEDVLADAEVNNDKIISFSSYVKLLEVVKETSGVRIVDEVKNNLKNLSAENGFGEESDEDLKATLYTYQELGLKWLNYITNENCGCILGDEMGLGKTMQIIALFLKHNSLKMSPYLVVAPVSLLENWKRELNKFAPSLKVCVHYGSKRSGFYKHLLDCDVVITAYSTIATDVSMFNMVTWDIMVLDEAQNIKSPTATRTRIIKEIPRRSSVAVTGTPFENHMTDLWSLLDFSMPGCLGTLREFSSQYSDDYRGAEKIEPILTALMIRRKVKEVADDLPEKIEATQVLEMSDVESTRYEDLRESIFNETDSTAALLKSFTILRRFCTHPSLTNEELIGKDPAQNSVKYTRLCELLDEIFDNKEKVILFTSYTEMFNILEQDIPKRFGVKVLTINGSTKVALRQQIVDEFSAMRTPALLVLNPKAAGTGLNITAATHVIHYNLEWNPALEDQATARAYRRGQDSKVTVHRLYYGDTVEDVVNEKILKSDIAVVGVQGTENEKELLLRALSLSPRIKER